MNASTQQSAYSALIPPTWPIWNLKPDLLTQFASNDVSTFGCGWNSQEGPAGVTHIFAEALVANQFQSLIQLTPSDETSTNEVWTFGNVPSVDDFDKTGEKAAVPISSLTDSLFSTAAFGAGAYAAAWFRSTYNPPANVVCGTSFETKSDYFESPPPPTIPPEAATPSVDDADSDFYRRLVEPPS